MESFKEMDFFPDEIKGDESTGYTKLPNEKRRKSKDMEESIKVGLWQSALAAPRVPEPAENSICPHLTDPDEQWLFSPQLKSLTPQQKSLKKLKIHTILHEMAFSGSSDAMFRYNI